jgi:hypothetical protein
VLEAGEIYLELTELDLDNETEIIAFANRWDILGISYGADHRLLPPELRSTLRRSSPPRKGPLRRRGLPPIPKEETLTEFRFAARCLRDVTRAWQSLNTSSDENFETEIAPGAPPDQFLQDMLNRGLLPFQPYIQLVTPPDNEPTSRRPRSPWTPGTVPLYSTCCLELYNHIIEHATYLICSNETCSRAFVRQTGRAQHGQHRSRGLQYCSRECARAQAQRALRARRRAQTNQ